MDRKRQTLVSKFLSYHLRHAPEELGLSLAPGGWVEVDVLLDACRTSRFPLTLDELRAVVADNEKQRFAFDEAGRRIRANQGHSVDVDLQLTPSSPPPLLYHGTPAAVVPAILAEGLKKMARHHVHLSPDVATAIKVGQRRGKPVVLEVATGRMHQDGHQFFVSANSVWLVDFVPPQYLRCLPPGSPAGS